MGEVNGENLSFRMLYFTIFEDKEELRKELIEELRSKGDIKILNINKDKVINLKNEIP